MVRARRPNPHAEVVRSPSRFRARRKMVLDAVPLLLTDVLP